MSIDTRRTWATVTIQLIAGLVAVAAAAIALLEVIAIIPGLDGSTGMNSYVDTETVLVIQGMFGLPSVLLMAATSVLGVRAVGDPTGRRLALVAGALAGALLWGVLWFFSYVGAYGS